VTPARNSTEAVSNNTRSDSEASIRDVNKPVENEVFLNITSISQRGHMIIKMDKQVVVP